MNMKFFLCCAVLLEGTVALASESGKGPALKTIGPLPARAISIPCENEQMAFDIVQMERPKGDSRWILPFTGESGLKKTGDTGLYTTTFRRPWRWWFRRTVLHFDGVSSAFRVRVNGQDVGCGDDSRLPFEFDLTSFLKVFGANTLEVEVAECGGDVGFREVYLVSECADAPFDLVVETRLSDDLKSGKFIVRDEKGKVLKERDVPEVRLWSNEQPFVYMTPIEHPWGLWSSCTWSWWPFGGTDCRAVTFGFRTVEVRDAVLRLNGKRLAVKGANRHATESGAGYVTAEGALLKDARRMKACNVNTVRTCLSPDDPAWYDLCDREGLMVVCAVDAECDARLVQTYRNHPSIVCWPAKSNGLNGLDWDFADRAFRKTGGCADSRLGVSEVKRTYQSIKCTAFDFVSGKVKVRNDFLFLTLEDHYCVWKSFAVDGTPAAKGTFELGEVAPGETAEFVLEGFAGDKVEFKFYGDAGWCACDLFDRR